VMSGWGIVEYSFHGCLTTLASSCRL